MASDLHHHNPGGARLLAIGGGLAGLLVLVGAVIMAQMSGCCGGAPTHGCKFIETKDASVDSSTDAMLPCGFDICLPGQTRCCFEAMSQPPFRCIPVVGGVCKGTFQNCAGDENCGGGTHCCGTLSPMGISCQAECAGDFEHGGNTVRICRSSAECPSDIPLCGTLFVGDLALYACQAQPMMSTPP